MAKVMYSDEDVTKFIDVAKTMGVGPAIRELNYPTMATAYTWFKQRNEEIPTVDSLQSRAAELRWFYSDQEKKYAAQRNLEAIVDSLETKQHDPDGINKLSNALHKTIQTFNLIDGKATTVTENQTKDSADLAIADLLNEAKANNALKESSIKNLP